MPSGLSLLPSILDRAQAAWARRSRKPVTPRTPTRADAQSSSLADLPADVILMILCQIQDVSPQSIIRVASVCSHFYYLARYVQHRDISIRLHDAGPNLSSLRDRLDFMSENRLLGAVRSLEVCETRDIKESSPAWSLLLHLAKLLPGMTGLRQIRWEAPVLPYEILQSMKQCPQMRIELHAHDGALLEGLVGSPNLSSVRIKGTYVGAKQCLAITQPMKRLMLTCPNLRRLSIDIAQPRQGCVVYGLLPEYTGFGFSNGERPPPLEDLEVISYPWGHEHKDAGSVSFAFHSVNYPEKGTEVDYWASTFDWSQLRRLRDADVAFASKIASKLTALKFVEFKSEWPSNTALLTQFFEDVPSSLECIVLPSLNSVSPPILKRHAESLRKLALHRQEKWDGTWSDRAITDQDLIALRSGLPLLEDLEVDVARQEGDWPWDTLKILSGFKLRSLKLWFDLGIKIDGVPSAPYLTAVSAAELFSFLRKSSPKQPCLLQRLHACSGAPPPLGHGLLVETAYWPGENSTSFICQVAERDDDAANGLFSVMCPKLDKELNAKMERITKGEEKRSDLGNEPIAFKVALNGPLAKNEWLNLRRAFMQ